MVRLLRETLEKIETRLRDHVADAAFDGFLKVLDEVDGLASTVGHPIHR